MGSSYDVNLPRFPHLCCLCSHTHHGPGFMTKGKDGWSVLLNSAVIDGQRPG